MNRWETMIRKLETPEISDRLAHLYGQDPETVKSQRERYAALIRRHGQLFGDRG